MSEFEKIMQAAAEEKEAKKPEKKSYRDVMRDRCYQLGAISDRAYTDIAHSRQAFADMLDIASRFLRNSVGNIMLIYGQNPNATELHSYDDWKKRNVTVKKGATGLYIFVKKQYKDAKGNERTAYDPDARIDILDTVDGKGTPVPSFDEKTLVKALIHASPVKVIVDRDFPEKEPVGAAYIKDKHEIRCRYGMPFEELVPTVLNAAALAYFCEVNDVSRPSDYEFKARCVAYILTKKCGISTQHIAIQSIPSVYEDMPLTDFKNEIAEILSVAQNMDKSLAQVLYRPQEQSKDQSTKEGDKELR